MSELETSFVLIDLTCSEKPARCHILAPGLRLQSGGNMQFKPSAGIFVAGLATSVGGAFFFAMGMGMAGSAAYDSGAGPAGLAFIGFAASVAGLVMLCIGATRALRIIDALPAAFRTINGGLGQPHQQTPAPQFHNHNQPQHQGYSQQPPVQ